MSARTQEQRLKTVVQEARKEWEADLVRLLIKTGLVKEEIACQLKQSTDPIATLKDGRSQSITSTHRERALKIADASPRKRTARQ
jgi:hypothetical protein